MNSQSMLSIFGILCYNKNIGRPNAGKVPTLLSGLR